MIHSKNCHCNDVDPGGKPDEIEGLPFALSAQGLQVREKNERAFERFVFEMLFLTCSVMCYTGIFLFAGICGLRRCSGALPGVPALLSPSTPQIWCQCGPLLQCLLTGDMYFCSDITVNWKPSVGCFFFKEEINSM